MNEVARDPHRLLAGLHRDGVSLELANLDVCFLAALYLRAEQDGLPAFGDGAREALRHARSER